MQSQADIQANLSLVKGFLKPHFYDEHMRPDQPTALSHTDFCKVRDGYACSRCLAEYTTYLPTCPVCGWQRDVAQDLKPPDPEHEDHLRRLRDTEGMDVGGMVNSFDEFMRSLEQKRDVEPIPLEKLAPRKWGKK